MTTTPPANKFNRLSYLILICAINFGSMVCVSDGSDKMVQPFQMKGGSKKWGVLVRKFDNKFVFALPHTVQEIPRRDVVSAFGGMSVEASKIDQLLTLIEDAINSDKIQRAELKLEPLDKAISEFEKTAKPFVEASVDTSYQRRECLKQAIEYYHQQRNSFPVSIQCLKLIKKFKHLELTSRDLNYAENDVLELISIRNELMELENMTARVEREKQRVLETIQDIFLKAYDYLKSDAIQRFISHAKTAKILDLFFLLKTGRGSTKIHGHKLEKLVNQCLQLNTESHNKLSSAINALLSTLGDSKDREKRNYENAVKNVRNLTHLLEEIEDLIFGSREKELRSRIKNAIKRNNEVIDSASIYKDKNTEIRADLRQAELLFEREEFKEAYAQFKRINEVISNSNLPGGEVLRKTEEGLIKSQAMFLLTDLRNPVTKSADKISQLASEAVEFLRLNGHQLSSYNISSTSIQRAIGRIKNYRKFLLRFEDLRSNQSSDSVQTWNRASLMSTWLKSLGAEIHKIAHFTWTNFLKENEDRLYEDAVTEFFNQYTTLDTKEFKVVTSFVQNRLRRGNPQHAFEVLGQSLFIMENQALKSHQEELQSLVLDIVVQFTQTAQQEKIKSVYKLIKKVDPDFADTILASDTIRFQLVKLAKWHIAENHFLQALETYESLAMDHSEYARSEGIYEKILDLYFSINGNAESGSADELKVIEMVCKKYSGFIGAISRVQARSQQIVQEVEDLWRPGKYPQAVDACLNFQKSYPSFEKETKVIDQALEKIGTKVSETSQALSDSNKGVSSSLTGSLHKLTQKFPSIAHDHKLDKLLVDLKLHSADKFLKNGQIRRAFDVYNEILINYKSIGEERRLDKKMEQLKWKYKMETVFAPIGITRSKDWIIFGFLVLVWPILFFRSYSLGKKKGHLRYRLFHFGTVFSIFFVLVCGFIYGKYSFFNAFLFAFALPAICFQFIGTSTHTFFPLVYYERLLVIEKQILNLIRKFSKNKSDSANPAVKRLEDDIARRENDLPILHDRMLYKIEKATHISSSKPDKGYELFEHLLRRLDQEMVKTETWKKHYSTCIYNLGALANHLNNTEKALEYLNKHLEYDPKSVDTRSILTEIALENGDFQGAIPHLKVCLSAYGNSDSLWFRLGQCYFETANFTSAYKCFSSIKKKDRNSLFFEARSCSRADELNKAIESYQMLLKLNSKDSEVIYYLASTLAHHGQDKKATKITGLIHDEDPYYARIQVLRGNILYKSKRVKEANEMFVTALKIDPSCIQAMIGLGQIAIDVNKTQQALLLFEKALQIDSEHFAANYFAGMLAEGESQEISISHYSKAAKASEFKRFAEKRIGIHAFFNGDYKKAVAHLASAVNSGEDSIWVIYLYGYALATTKQFSSCQSTLAKMVRLGQTDSVWNSKVGSAMYSLGLNLFDKQEFNLALKCFQFVKGRDQGGHNSDAIDELLEEAKFRMVVQLLDKAELKKAQTTLAELMSQSKDPSRKSTYNYYLTLCFLYQKHYKEAKKILSALLSRNPSNPHYLYHIVIAELGEGNDQEAAKLLIKFRGLFSVPEHLRVGVQMIRAYLSAKRGKMRNAESSLTKISELDKDFPGGEYIRQQVLMSRLFYLCHVRDSRKIHDIIPQLKGQLKRRAILLHAIAAVESGQLKVAKDILNPYLKESDGNKKLYSTVCTELAVKAISKKDYKEARAIFEEIPDRSGVIENISLLLNMAELLEDIDNFESITRAIIELSDFLPTVEDDQLRHSLIHNLGILQLKRAIMAEETGGRDMIDDLWQSCWQFWMTNIFKSREYWNAEQKKFSGSDQNEKAFSQKEVEVIYKKFIDENLADMFLCYLMSYLQEANENGVNRHLGLLQMIADETGNSEIYFAKLREQLTVFLRSIDKTDERFLTWSFSILSTSLQCAASKVLKLNDYQELSQRLENFKEFSIKYSTPNDYRNAQKQFNTKLFDALHLGIDGKFGDAGNRLEKLLNNHFQDELEEETKEELTAIRETCRRMSKNSTNTEQIKKKFEVMYANLTGNKSGSDSGF